MWQTVLFDRLTRISFWLSLLVGAAVAIQEAVSGEWAVTPLVFSSVFLFGLTAWAPRLSRKRRAVLYLLVIWFACGGTLLRSGFWLAPPFVLVSSVAVVLGLSISPKMGWSTIVGFVVILVALAFHFVKGGTPIGVERFQLDVASNWARVIVVFFAVSALSLAAVTFLVRRLKHADESNQELFEALREEGAQKIKSLKREREMVERLQDSQKLEALGRLAGGVAHDFNNLLTVIIGNAELLRELSTQPKEELEEIAEAGRRASDLSQQLLLFSRKQSMTRESADFNSALKASAGLLKRLMPSSVQLKLKLGNSVGPLCFSRSELDQLVMNLCLNARDAMDGTGTLKLTSSRVTRARPSNALDSPDPEDETFVLLEVEDTGAGMSADVHKHLFEPFFTTKSVGQGTGLGLSVVHGIVSSYGGFIEVTSKLGIGTRFSLYLPAKTTVAEEVEPASMKPPPEELRGSETLLVVDDNQAVLRVTTKILRGAGYRVLACTGGDEALAQFREEQKHIRLLITDAVMPKMGGRELFARIHSERPDLPVLFCSGYDSGTLPTEFFEERRRSLLQKPFEAPKLLRLVRQLLDD